MKNGIVFVFEDERIKFVKSYSFTAGYKIVNYVVNPIYVKVNLTDDLNDAFNWKENYQIESAYDNIKGILQLNTNVKSILKINSNVYKRWLKTKKLKEICQSLREINI